MNRFHGFSSVCCCLALTSGSLPALAAEPTTAECLAANNSSIKERNESRLRNARAQLLICSAASCPEDIRNECVRRVAQVNASMPTLVFDVKDAQGSDLSAVKLTMDGQPLAERLVGAAFSIDPGEHSFTFETAGHPPITKTFVVLEGAKGRRELIVFGQPPGSAPAAPGPAADTSQPSAATAATDHGTPPPVAESEGLGAQRWVGIGVGVAGAATIGVGIGVYLKGKARREDALAPCTLGPTGTYCPEDDAAAIYAEAERAGKQKTTGVVVASVGGGVLALGALIFLLAPESKSRSAQASGPEVHVGVGPGEVMLFGRF